MFKLTLLSLLLVLLCKIDFLEGRNFKLSVVFESFSAAELCCNYHYYSFYAYRFCTCDPQVFEFCLRKSSSNDPITDANCKDGVQRTRPIVDPYSYRSYMSEGLYSMEYLFNEWPEHLYFFIGRKIGSIHTHSIYFSEDLTSHAQRILNFRENGLHVRLDVNLGCIPDYYGSQCNVYCVAQDHETSGHYTCSNNGEIVCRQGWSNPNGRCLTAICAAGCNSTYGSCKVPNECNCDQGWTGSDCDQCIPTEGCYSEEGGYCIDTNQCLCRPYYNGALCRNFTGDNQCKRHFICYDQGQCVADGEFNYTCNCYPGFTGYRCEINIDDCTPNPCQNQGTCIDGVNSFTCDCAPGWTGQMCSIDIDDCHDGPCENGGTCKDLVNGYMCSCRSTFTGRNCEIDVDECANVESNTCTLGRGWCVNQVGGYTCECYSDFSGQHCENDFNECRSSPCFNGGKCINHKNGYTCDCPSTHTGDLCNETFCMSSPCKNAAECQELLGGYLCLCPPELTGRNCDAELKDTVGSNLSVVSLILITFGILINIVIILIIIVAIIMYKKKSTKKTSHKHSSNVQRKKKKKDNIYVMS